MVIPVEQLVFFFVILVRISAFIYTGPFFSLKNVPQKVKIGLSLTIAIILNQTIPYSELVYEGVIGFGILIVGEALAGAIMGFFSNICFQILSLAGQLMDMEIGFSMVNEFDPFTNAQVTITANFYHYAVMLFLLITNMHHYIIKALVDSYQLIPVGGAKLNPLISTVMIQFVVDFFVIAFRIILPIFAAMLIVNVVLAILAKVAPQMNMFVIGLQLKVLIGFIVLLFMTLMIPSVSDFIFTEMMEMLKSAISFLK
ncbi:MAG TPA: flagellar biosynthetic protein FliR [Lachnoclostridium phytofermentans]|uniref:Flagellar biosynthetic protein FliR n=1 Tax=Lachnoclostridium phytofermentans TaxID=66219 RepID=A0A3D2X8W4_9FIRM|nr:flagellar biosynthetic protein FliR [Lachnoclostridium sp.]HCL03364.1 flagellar biosynthetic protein FliR [Lachnoclostridium phytofermentans]